MKTLVLAIALLAGTAFAEDAPAPALAPGSSSGTLQLTLYLVLLLVLFVAGMFFLRNGFTLFQPKIKGERKLDISETRMLGNRQFLVVAAYEGRKVLIGVCPGRIDYLCALSDAEPQFPKIAPEKCDA